MSEIQLPLKRDRGRNAALIWTKCAPFVENSRGILIHRPRTVVTYNIHKHPHIGIGYWCGNHVSGGKTFTFLSIPPTNKLLCVRCEANATASDLPSADSLAGRHVHTGKLKAIQTCCYEELP